MARKRKTYTTDELKAVRRQLEEHAQTLQARILMWSATSSVDFDLACEIRDTAQQLVSTLLALQTIETSIKLADFHQAGPQYLAFNLDDCGLAE